MTAFLASLAKDDLAPATLRGYRYDLQHFLAWRQSIQDGPFTLEGLAGYDLIAYRQHMVTTGRQPATVNRRLDALRRLCRWAQACGSLATDAARDVRPIRMVRNQQPVGLTDVEVHAFRPMRCGTPLPLVTCATIPASWLNSPACSAMRHSTRRPFIRARRVTTSRLTWSARISMSMGDCATAASQARRPTAIPADPSEDELARHWSLTPADLAAVAMCRGSDQRRRFALQLCAVRAQGRFLDDYRQAPLKIVNHLSRQLGLRHVAPISAGLLRPAL